MLRNPNRFDRLILVMGILICTDVAQIPELHLLVSIIVAQEAEEPESLELIVSQWESALQLEMKIC